MASWDPKTFKKTTLTSGPYPNQSFVAVMTEAEIAASKANIGAMIYQTDGAPGLYVYLAGGWTKVE